MQLNEGSFDGALSYLGGLPTLPLPVNLAITVAAFFFLERFRADGGEQPNMPPIFPNGPAADKLYPGGSFDPLVRRAVSRSAAGCSAAPLRLRRAWLRTRLRSRS